MFNPEYFNILKSILALPEPIRSHRLQTELGYYLVAEGLASVLMPSAIIPLTPDLAAIANLPLEPNRAASPLPASPFAGASTAAATFVPATSGPIRRAAPVPTTPAPALAHPNIGTITATTPSTPSAALSAPNKRKSNDFDAIAAAIQPHAITNLIANDPRGSMDAITASAPKKSRLANPKSKSSSPDDDTIAAGSTKADWMKVIGRHMRGRRLCMHEDDPATTARILSVAAGIPEAFTTPQVIAKAIRDGDRTTASGVGGPLKAIMKQAVEEVREVVEALQIESHDPNLVTSAYSGDEKDWAHIIMFNTVDEIVDGKAVPKVVMRKFMQMWVTHELQVTGPKLYLDMSRYFQAANRIALNDGREAPSPLIVDRHRAIVASCVVRVLTALHQQLALEPKTAALAKMWQSNTDQASKKAAVWVALDELPDSDPQIMALRAGVQLAVAGVDHAAAKMCGWGKDKVTAGAATGVEGGAAAEGQEGGDADEGGE
ncbi:hypothetical protein BCR44DRAFT_45331 [Catenaria anguillulae PL171]|uniref:Uncharacterized protein n=1 Tax=Catenaria anguillulae PL171 TaxID=765915 RepID=A0A1Y2I5Q2_9FUNG|nr:hypothetical protein BCR44DRAFT_45331 [Catenaria anguillulae PL171]